MTLKDRTAFVCMCVIQRANERERGRERERERVGGGGGKEGGRERETVYSHFFSVFFDMTALYLQCILVVRRDHL